MTDVAVTKNSQFKSARSKSRFSSMTMVSMSQQKDLLILYNSEDADDWRKYLEGLIQMGLGDSVHSDWKNIEECTQENIMSLCGQYHLLVVFVSPKMLDNLELDTDLLRPFINAQKHVAMIRLFINQEDFESVVKNEYRQTEKWKILDITSDETENETMLSKLMDRLQSARTPPTPSTRPKRKSSPSEKKLSSSVLKAINPEQIKIAGERVLLVFCKSYQNETVQVSFDQDQQLFDTIQLNPYCFQFKAPAHRPGNVTVYVFVDGKKTCKVKVKYTKPATFAYTTPEYLSQVLNIDPDENTHDLKQLDKKLAQIFNSSAPCDSSLAYILSPRNVSESSHGKKSDDFLPTLLHFACYYGLQDLCSCVMDTPGSAFAFEIKNCYDQNPLDLARESQHEELADYIETFLEMQDYVGVCGDIYEKMTNQALGGYMHMSGSTGEEVVGAYDEGRIASLGSEDGYILTDRTSQVEEVLEEEDVTAKPEVPERKDRPKPMTSQNLTPHRTVPPVPQQQFNEPPLPRDDEFFKPLPMSPAAMGSSNLAELIDYQEMFKRNEVSLGDIERLYGAWMQRNTQNTTSSFKDRKKQIDQMKEEFQCKPLVKNDEKKSFLGRLTTSREQFEAPALHIRHNVVQNKYIDWKPGVFSDITHGNRDSFGSNRDSITSTCSTTSTSSSGSRDSALDPIREYSDSEPDEMAPPVPYRHQSTICDPMAPPVPDRDRLPSEKRNSLGKTFLDNLRSPRTSRLPPVPAIRQPIRNQKRGTRPP